MKALEIMVKQDRSRTGDGRKRPSPLLRKWATLLISFFLVWLFAFVVAPWMQRVSSVKQMADYIERSGINASAFYYTDVEEVSDAYLNIRSTFEYLPHGEEEVPTSE